MCPDVRSAVTGAAGVHLQRRELKQPWRVLGTVKNTSTHTRTHTSAPLRCKTQAQCQPLGLNGVARYLSGAEYSRKRAACFTDLPITSWANGKHIKGIKHGVRISSRNLDF